MKILPQVACLGFSLSLSLYPFSLYLLSLYLSISPSLFSLSLYLLLSLSLSLCLSRLFSRFSTKVPTKDFIGCTRQGISGATLAIVQGKKKHINTNKLGGLSRDRVGGKNVFMYFVQVIPCGGRTHKQNPPKNPETIARGRRVCRTKLPRPFSNRYEKWFEKLEKGSENNPKCVRIFNPSHAT